MPDEMETGAVVVSAEDLPLVSRAASNNDLTAVSLESFLGPSFRPVGDAPSIETIDSHVQEGRILQAYLDLEHSLREGSAEKAWILDMQGLLSLYVGDYTTAERKFSEAYQADPDGAESFAAVNLTILAIAQDKKLPEIKFWFDKIPATEEDYRGLLGLFVDSTAGQQALSQQPSTDRAALSQKVSAWIAKKNSAGSLEAIALNDFNVAAGLCFLSIEPEFSQQYFAALQAIRCLGAQYERVSGEEHYLHQLMSIRYQYGVGEYSECMKICVRAFHSNEDLHIMKGFFSASVGALFCNNASIQASPVKESLKQFLAISDSDIFMPIVNGLSPVKQYELYRVLMYYLECALNYMDAYCLSRKLQLSDIPLLQALYYEKEASYQLFFGDSDAAEAAIGHAIEHYKGVSAGSDDNSQSKADDAILRCQSLSSAIFSNKSQTNALEEREYVAILAFNRKNFLSSQQLFEGMSSAYPYHPAKPKWIFYLYQIFSAQKDSGRASAKLIELKQHCALSKDVTLAEYTAKYEADNGDSLLIKQAYTYLDDLRKSKNYITYPPVERLYERVKESFQRDRVRALAKSLLKDFEARKLTIAPKGEQKQLEAIESIFIKFFENNASALEFLLSGKDSSKELSALSKKFQGAASADSKLNLTKKQNELLGLTKSWWSECSALPIVLAGKKDVAIQTTCSAGSIVGTENIRLFTNTLPVTPSVDSKHNAFKRTLCNCLGESFMHAKGIVTGEYQKPPTDSQHLLEVAETFAGLATNLPLLTSMASSISIGCKLFRHVIRWSQNKNDQVAAGRLVKVAGDFVDVAVLCDAVSKVLLVVFAEQITMLDSDSITKFCECLSLFMITYIATNGGEDAIGYCGKAKRALVNLPKAVWRSITNTLQGGNEPKTEKVTNNLELFLKALTWTDGLKTVTPLRRENDPHQSNTNPITVEGILTHSGIKTPEGVCYANPKYASDIEKYGYRVLPPAFVEKLAKELNYNRLQPQSQRTNALTM